MNDVETVKGSLPIRLTPKRPEAILGAVLKAGRAWLSPRGP